MTKHLFGERFKKLIIDSGFTQKEIAEKLKTTPTTITRYVKGKREPDFDTVKRISELFECDIEYLLGETNFKNQNELNKMLVDVLLEKNILEKATEKISSDKLDEIRKVAEHMFDMYNDIHNK